MSEQTTFSPAMERFFEELRKCGPFVHADIGHKRPCIRRQYGMHGDGSPDNCCPLGEVANLQLGERLFALNFRQAAQFLNLTQDEALSIAVAADYSQEHSEFNPALRARLLECCGLSEVGT